MKKILVIDNHDSFVYNLIEQLRINGQCQYDVVFDDVLDIARAATYDGFLLSPGPGTPKDSPLMMELIRTYYQTHSFLGVCLGHQALALAFHGKIEQMNMPKHGHTSRLHIIDRKDSLLGNIPQDTPIGRYHSWMVSNSSLPTDFHVSATDDEGNIMAFVHNYLPLHAVQFHPESIMSTYGQTMIDNWIKELTNKQ